MNIKKIIGIDPGQYHLGCAVGIITGKKFRIDRTHYVDYAENDFIQNPYVLDVLDAFIKFDGIRKTETLLVVEKPQIWPYQPFKHSTIVDLSFKAGVYNGYLCHCYASKCLSPTAKEWKGQIPKEAHHVRLLSAHKELAEVKGKGQEHMLDAAGLSIWGFEQIKGK